MEKNIMIELNKNVENFDNILSNFFAKKALTIDNYYFETDNLEKLLMQNFQELKIILEKKKCIEKIKQYMKRKTKEVDFEIENCADFLKYELLFLRERHYFNILEYLEKNDQKSNTIFDIIDKKFFSYLRDGLFDHFLGKH